MLRELLPLCAEVVFTQSANPRALPAGTLESLCGQLGGPPRADGGRAAPRARRGARGGGPGRRRARDRLDLPHRRSAAAGGRAREVDAVSDDGPSMPAMIALVAVVVALVILLFFGLGYGFGRLFL